MFLIKLLQRYLLLAAIYTLLALLKERKIKNVTKRRRELPSSVAVVIPAYRADDYLPDTADSLCSSKGIDKNMETAVCRQYNPILMNKLGHILFIL